MIKLYKRYVDVLTLHDRYGNLIPKVMIWDNGMEYPIDRVLEIRKSASQVGGCGVLYRCRIAGVERNLFLERTRWFIESAKP